MQVKDLKGVSEEIRNKVILAELALAGVPVYRSESPDATMFGVLALEGGPRHVVFVRRDCDYHVLFEQPLSWDDYRDLDRQWQEVRNANGLVGILGDNDMYWSELDPETGDGKDMEIISCSAGYVEALNFLVRTLERKFAHGVIIAGVKVKTDHQDSSEKKPLLWVETPSEKRKLARMRISALLALSHARADDRLTAIKLIEEALALSNKYIGPDMPRSIGLRARLVKLYDLQFTELGNRLDFVPTETSDVNELIAQVDRVDAIKPIAELAESLQIKLIHAVTALGHHSEVKSCQRKLSEVQNLLEKLLKFQVSYYVAAFKHLGSDQDWPSKWNALGSWRMHYDSHLAGLSSALLDLSDLYRRMRRYALAARTARRDFDGAKSLPTGTLRDLHAHMLLLGGMEGREAVIKDLRRTAKR
jgi:hypothetical protein